MSWITTYTGKSFVFESDDVTTINITDIAHSLSNLCRFNGHAKEFYSVAEHSILLSYQVSKEAALYGLLHDAAEAYIGDVVTPLKTTEIRKLEHRIMQRIVKRFSVNVTDEIKAEVKQADLRMLATEKQQLIKTDRYFSQLKDIKPYEHIKCECVPNHKVRNLFVDRFLELRGF